MRDAFILENDLLLFISEGGPGLRDPVATSLAIRIHPQPLFRYEQKLDNKWAGKCRANLV